MDYLSNSYTFDFIKSGGIKGETETAVFFYRDIHVLLEFDA